MDQPKVLTLLLTYACNLKCTFCGQKDHRKHRAGSGEKLELPAIEAILDDAAACGIKNVNLWGGEPLLHPALFEIIAAVSKRRMRPFLVTNGSLLAARAVEICQSKLLFMQVSIDAPFEQHDAIRNVPGLFAKLTAGIKSVNERKRIFPQISSCTVIFPGNVDVLEETVDAIFASGVSTAFFQFVMSYSEPVLAAYKQRLNTDYGLPGSSLTRIDAFKGPELTEAEFARAAAALQKAKQKHGEKVIYPVILDDPGGFACYNQRSGPFPAEKTGGCWSLNHKINVEPNGDVVACPDFPDFKFGNIFSSSISEIWNSPVRRDFKKKFYSGKPLPICYKCCQLWDREGYNSWKDIKL